MTWESAEMILWKCRVATMGPPSQTDALHPRGRAPSLILCRHKPATLCDAIILRPRCDASTHCYDGGRSCDNMRTLEAFRHGLRELGYKVEPAGEMWHHRNVPLS